MWHWVIHMHYFVTASQPCEIIMIILLLKVTPGLRRTERSYLHARRCMADLGLALKSRTLSGLFSQHSFWEMMENSHYIVSTQG